MIHVVDALESSYNVRTCMEGYALAVRAFGEMVPPGWVDERLAGIADGSEFCLAAASEEGLKGILSYSYRDNKGYSFISWQSDEVDREGLILLLKEYLSRSPTGMKLRISGFHPNVTNEMMSGVVKTMGFQTKRRFEMKAALDSRVDEFETAIQLPTTSIAKVEEAILSRLDWEAYKGTVDESLLFESEDENRKLIRSLLSGDYGPLIVDASLCVLKDGKPVGMIAVTDMGESSFIADIVVSSEMRGKGIGNYLLLNAMKVSRKLKKEEMMLWVSEGNDTALSLYRKSGFTLSRTGIYYLREGKQL